MQFEQVIKQQYKIRKIDLRDEDLLLDLCIRCTDFFRLVEGRTPNSNDSARILEELPRGKQYFDKFVLGIFDRHDKLIGVMDLIKDFPIKGEWVIGRLMLDPTVRGIGIGKNVHEYVKNQMLQTDAAQIRICISENNTEAYGFCKNLGYKELGRKKYKMGNKYNVFIIMILSLLN